MTAQRIAFVSILTACMFGFSTLMQDGLFLLPFPLFRIGLFGIVLTLFIKEKKELKWADWFLFVWSFCLAISSHFLLEILFNETQLVEYKNQIDQFSAYSMILFACFFFVWQLQQISTLRSVDQWFIIVGALLFFVGMLTNYMILLPIGLVIWYIGIKLSKNIRPTTEAVALLLLFILLAVIASITYFGSVKVLAYL